MRLLPPRERFQYPARLLPAAAPEFRHVQWAMASSANDLRVHAFPTIVRPRASSRIPAGRNRLKERRAHFVVKIFRRQFSLSALGQAFAHIGREFCHSSAEGFDQHVGSQGPGLSCVNPPRNGMLRRRTDSAAGTSSGRIAVACTPPFAAIRPSSRSACHRRNSLNSRDKRASARIREWRKLRPRPLPPIPHQIVTPRMRSRLRKSPHRAGSQCGKSKLPCRSLGASSPQGYTRSRRPPRSIRRPMKLCFARQLTPQPFRICAGFRVAHISRPVQRQANLSEHRASTSKDSRRDSKTPDAPCLPFLSTPTPLYSTA